MGEGGGGFSVAGGEKETRKLRNRKKKGKKGDNKKQDTRDHSGFQWSRCFFFTVPSSFIRASLLTSIRSSILFVRPSTQTGYSVFYFDWEPEHTGLGAVGRRVDGGWG